MQGGSRYPSPTLRQWQQLHLCSTCQNNTQTGKSTEIFMELNSDFTSFTSICLCVCVCVHMFSFTHVCNRHQIQEAACSSAQVPSHQTFVASPTLLPPSPSLTSGICSSVLYLCDFILVLYKRNHPLCNLLSWSLFTQDSFEIHSS